MRRKAKVLYVDFKNKRKSRFLLWLILPIVLLASAAVCWFIYVNSQAGIESLSPVEITAQLTASRTVDVRMADGEKLKAAVDSEKAGTLDETLWEQTSLENALSVKADITVKLKAGASRCELRLIDDSNVVIAILNNYYRCYKLPEQEFKKLKSVFV